VHIVLSEMGFIEETESDAESFHSAHGDHHEEDFHDAEDADVPLANSQPLDSTSQTASKEASIAQSSPSKPPLPPRNEAPSNNTTDPSDGTTAPSAPSDPVPPVERFSPEEESSLLAASSELKSTGNSLFGSASFAEAIQTYDKALASCPAYLDYEIAVLRANIAACHLKLTEWKEAVEQATKSLECLDRLDPLPRPVKEDDSREEKVDQNKAEKVTNGEPPLNSHGRPRPTPVRPVPARPSKSYAPTSAPGTITELDDMAATAMEALALSGHTYSEVQKLRIKAVMRRSSASSSLNTWSSLQSASEDYNLLLSPKLQPSLSPGDMRTVKVAVAGLAPRLEDAKKREVDEMMGKLKDLGNGLLKPFGLSTDMFNFVKGEGGGYSMNFEGGPGGKKT
jgi:tetratricopeptide (TPR) repeat protein